MGDEDEALAKQAPDVAFGFDAGPPDREFVSTIPLGASVGRQRPGGPFLSPDRFCFAVAWVDRSGNRGERSEARCLETDDPNDPTVEFVEGSPSCACSSVGAPAPGGLGALGSAGLAVYRFRAPRRPHSSRRRRSAR